MRQIGLLKGSLVVAAIAMGLSACSTYENRESESVTKLMSITQYDTRKDFNKYETFSVSDTMMVLNGKDTLRLRNNYTQWVSSQLRTQMIGLGYREAAKEQKPDLYILLSGVKSTAFTYTRSTWGFYTPSYWAYNPSYWGSSYGGWGCTYYYPCYPMLTSAYTVGSLLMEMVDIKNANEEKKIFEIVWLGLVRGLMDVDHTEAEVRTAVSDCFNQVKLKK